MRKTTSLPFVTIGISSRDSKDVTASFIVFSSLSILEPVQVLAVLASLSFSKLDIVSLVFTLDQVDSLETTESLIPLDLITSSCENSIWPLLSPLIKNIVSEI